MALFLRDEEVNQAVSMDEMLVAIEDMQRHYGHGEVMNLGRRKIIAPGGMLSVMGGGLFYDGILGVKTYTVVQANRLGQLRTGATTGVAVKHLSNPDAATVGIIGTGYQAPTQLEAVSKVRNLRKVKAYSRTQERRDAFAQAMTNSLGVEVDSVDSSEEAVSGSDIVICIAAVLDPVLQGEWLSPGATVIGAGPTTWRAREVDDATFARAARIFVDSPEQAPIEVGDMAGAVDRGILQWSQLQELRHVVADQIIYAKLMGTGVADVAAAKLAHDNAKSRGLGMEMEW